MLNRRLFGSRLLGALAAASGVPTFASPPDRPIRVIVPYGAGGLIDVGTRIVAQAMSQTLAAPVVIDNKPGANANIGAALAAQAPADGLTLLASSSYFTTNPLVEPQLRWSPSN